MFNFPSFPDVATYVLLGSTWKLLIPPLWSRLKSKVFLLMVLYIYNWPSSDAARTHLSWTELIFLMPESKVITDLLSASISLVSSMLAQILNCFSSPPKASVSYPTRLIELVLHGSSISFSKDIWLSFTPKSRMVFPPSTVPIWPLLKHISP